MELKRLLLRIPFVNIFYFAFCPKTAYSEYLRWVMEEHDITMEELWKQLSEKEKKALEDFGMAPEPVQPPTENISGNSKENDGDCQ
jgi:hypothetical protein